MMTPLFATISTQSMDMDTTVNESMDGGQLRETQDANQFTATQDGKLTPCKIVRAWTVDSQTCL